MKGTAEEKRVNNKSKGVTSRSCPKKPIQKANRSLSLREKRLIQYLQTEKTTTDAMRKAGYSESVIHSGKARRDVLQKPTIIEACESIGLTDNKILNTLCKGLDANKVISANVIASSKEEMSDAHSMTKDFIEVEDWQSRLKAVDISLKLKNKYPADKIDHSVIIETHEDRIRRLRGEET